MAKRGRPRKIKDSLELQTKIDSYFATHPTIRTISGLALHCGFASRGAFYAQEERAELKDTINKARSRIEEHYETMGQTLKANWGFAVFALKNFGWTDKCEVTTNGTITNVIQFPSKKKVGDPCDMAAHTTAS
jgi:hypothetical protein